MSVVRHPLLWGSLLCLSLIGCAAPEDSGALKKVSVTAQLTSASALRAAGTLRTSQKSIIGGEVQSAFAIALPEANSTLSDITLNSPIQASGPVEIDNTVTLSVPVNTALRLVVGGFTQRIQTVEEALSNSPATVFTSSTFQVGSGTTEMTLLLTEASVSSDGDSNPVSDNTTGLDNGSTTDPPPVIADNASAIVDNATALDNGSTTDNTTLLDNTTGSDNATGSLKALSYFAGCSAIVRNWDSTGTLDNQTPSTGFSFPVAFSESMDNTTIQPSSDCTQDAVQLLEGTQCHTLNVNLFMAVVPPDDVKARLPFVPPDNQGSFQYFVDSLGVGNYTIHINTTAESIFGHTLTAAVASPFTLVADNGSATGCLYLDNNSLSP